MIISASRRTDIPAFYTEWLINRIRAGYCLVPNPFNPRQVSRISLLPQDVSAIVFWTRSAEKLMIYLDELDGRGYRYYFQHTLLDYPRPIEPLRSPLGRRLEAFHGLAERIGPERVIWRYDPIVISEVTLPEFHLKTFNKLARNLRGYTQRCVVSVLDIYRKAKRNLERMEVEGAKLLPSQDGAAPWFGKLMEGLTEIGQHNEMEVTSCAEEIDLQPYGIRPGKCIDDEYIQRIFGIEVGHAKDPGQRKACGCVASVDIGMYDTCLYGCRYCYATRSFEAARANFARHDPQGEALLGIP